MKNLFYNQFSQYAYNFDFLSYYNVLYSENNYKNWLKVIFVIFNSVKIEVV